MLIDHNCALGRQAIVAQRDSHWTINRFTLGGVWDPDYSQISFLGEKFKTDTTY